MTQVGAGATGLVALMVGTIRYNNGVRSNSVTPAVAGVEHERAILCCMSVGTVDVRLKKEKGGSSVVARGATRYIRHIYSLAV